MIMRKVVARARFELASPGNPFWDPEPGILGPRGLTARRPGYMESFIKEKIKPFPA